MANFVKKFKRKHRLSTEMHDRWGDTAISYPNQGSWNQWNQTSGFAANASATIESRPAESDGPRRYIPTTSNSVAPSHQGWSDASSQTMRTSPESTHSTHEKPEHEIPKGYFDENIRHRTASERAPKHHIRGLGINGPPQEVPHTHIPSPMDLDVDVDIIDDYDHYSDESCDEEDEERDTLGDSRCLMTRGYSSGDVPRREECGSYSDRPAPSPALSVTSRMRRASVQSSTTQASSAAGTCSRRTSCTAASSVSAPSLPPDTPQYPVNTMHSAQPEKRHVPRPKPREPDHLAQQQMVPGYDELYG
ncbi:uncharacterized protein N7483_005825 [Penicillium malachiteum]|uniref:uncharacterized protein n=1 Tax=Penicillium malachiteum TaxID=1324776 RepID=UPI0025491E38|nr:uncharacterized protein N7483_005825 [Penicillium malachiteum]KAJ5731317.1 hypothetical protein N7483_005825 [Penicillium malachiteum]